ncbi:hypothetical protein ACTVZO_42120 [Streptomyces sp. IBSNAI002]|uniref:hypothetical protein n=1 Tax=Streptomyces sp. IBSNAI002 TaxID=3457500 RepID=UPI003FD50551
MDHTTQAAAAGALAALTRLTGRAPRITRHAGYLLLRIDPVGIHAGQWPLVVEVLESGSAYGMTTTAAGTRAIWLRIDDAETPHR